MDKYIAEKNNFSIALEALKEGRTIHRAGGIRKYSTRTLIYREKTIIEYGTTWNDGEDFMQGINFSIEDVLADNWIIEEKK
jgi:hypothetical protein